MNAVIFIFFLPSAGPQSPNQRPTDGSFRLVPEKTGGISGASQGRQRPFAAAVAMMV